MKLNLETIKQTLVNENEVCVGISAFNEDMNIMKDYYESDKSLIEFSEGYLSELFGFNIEIKESDQYIKINKL